MEIVKISIEKSTEEKLVGFSLALLAVIGINIVWTKIIEFLRNLEDEAIDVEKSLEESLKETAQEMRDSEGF